MTTRAEPGNTCPCRIAIWSAKCSGPTCPRLCIRHNSRRPSWWPTVDGGPCRVRINGHTAGEPRGPRQCGPLCRREPRGVLARVTRAGAIL